MRTRALMLFTVLAVAGIPALAFAGGATLRNRDSATYHFKVKCGGSTKLNASIGGSAVRTLEDTGDNCELEVDGVGNEDLEDGAECEISGGRLSCD